MTIFLFRSRIDTALFAFTPHSDGASLPEPKAPWLPLGDVPADSGIPHSIRETMVRDGFYLERCNVTVTISSRDDDDDDVRGQPR